MDSSKNLLLNQFKSLEKCTVMDTDRNVTQDKKQKTFK